MPLPDGPCDFILENRNDSFINWTDWVLEFNSLMHLCCCSDKQLTGGEAYQWITYFGLFLTQSYYMPSEYKPLTRYLCCFVYFWNLKSKILIFKWTILLTWVLAWYSYSFLLPKHQRSHKSTFSNSVPGDSTVYFSKPSFTPLVWIGTASEYHWLQSHLQNEA